MGVHMHVYGVWEYYCNKNDEALKTYQNTTGTTAKLVLDRPMLEMLEETKIKVCKFIMLLPSQDVESVIEALEAENFEDCAITKSSKHLVEVVNARCSKGTAVEFLSNYYGVPIEKTVGVGDQWNDIPMIETAGVGVAVQNADEKLKEMADYVCERTNNDGAVAEVIEKYGFTE